MAKFIGDNISWNSSVSLLRYLYERELMKFLNSGIGLFLFSFVYREPERGWKYRILPARNQSLLSCTIRWQWHPVGCGDWFSSSSSEIFSVSRSLGFHQLAALCLMEWSSCRCWSQWREKDSSSRLNRSLCATYTPNSNKLHGWTWCGTATMQIHWRVQEEPSEGNEREGRY